MPRAAFILSILATGSFISIARPATKAWKEDRFACTSWAEQCQTKQISRDKIPKNDFELRLFDTNVNLALQLKLPCTGHCLDTEH